MLLAQDHSLHWYACLWLQRLQEECQIGLLHTLWCRTGVVWLIESPISIDITACPYTDPVYIWYRALPLGSPRNIAGKMLPLEDYLCDRCWPYLTGPNTLGPVEWNGGRDIGTLNEKEWLMDLDWARLRNGFLMRNSFWNEYRSCEYEKAACYASSEGVEARWGILIVKHAIILRIRNCLRWTWRALLIWRRVYEIEICTSKK